MKSIVLAVLVLTAMALAWPASASDEVTVGDFIQRLAQEKHLNSADARIAVESLSEAGIHLPPDLELSTRLTEGDVARISRALGLAVSTNRPGAGFSGQQVDKFFASFRVEFTLAPDGGDLDSARGAVSDTQFNPYTKGKGGSKGKKRGHDFTPTEPE